MALVEAIAASGPIHGLAFARERAVARLVGGGVGLPAGRITESPPLLTGRRAFAFLTLFLLRLFRRLRLNHLPLRFARSALGFAFGDDPAVYRVTIDDPGFRHDVFFLRLRRAGRSLTPDPPRPRPGLSLWESANNLG